MRELAVVVSAKLEDEERAATIEKVKEYIIPTIEKIDIYKEDIITTSPGTETTPKDETDGIWDLDLG